MERGNPGGKEGKGKKVKTEERGCRRESGRLGRERQGEKQRPGQEGEKEARYRVWEESEEEKEEEKEEKKGKGESQDCISGKNVA